MKRVQIHVDETIVYKMATGIIGSEVRLSERSGSSLGINFKILLRQDIGTEKSTTTKSSELLPELLAEAMNDAITERITDLASARSRFVAGMDGAYNSGAPIVISNVQLSLDDKDPKAVLGTEDCVRYVLQGSNTCIHAFCLPKAEPILDTLVKKPLEVLGILRYTAPYNVPGAFPLNLGLRICAIWVL